MKSFLKLKANYDFRRIYNKGRSFVCPYFVTYAAKGRKNRIRFGITVSKKLGGAVKRNRAKRLITAAFREVSPHILKGNDFVFVARTRILDVKSTVVKCELEKQLKNNGLWCDYETDELRCDKAD